MAVPPRDVGAGYVRDVLNARFNAGAPTNDLNAAGVLVHVFDGHLDARAPWHTVQDGWMQQYSLILSTSLVNARKHGVFAGDAGGIVLSPRSTVLCAYPYDGGAMNFANGCGPSWCSEPNNIWGCAFPPSMLYRMQQIHEGGPQWPYNEVVVDANGIIIEAVFGGRGGAAEAMHARLIAHFGLTANQLPFLGFSGRARSNPFWST